MCSNQLIGSSKLVQWSGGPTLVVVQNVVSNRLCASVQWCIGTSALRCAPLAALKTMVHAACTVPNDAEPCKGQHVESRRARQAARVTAKSVSAGRHAVVLR